MMPKLQKLASLAQEICTLCMGIDTGVAGAANQVRHSPNNFGRCDMPHHKNLLMRYAAAPINATYQSRKSEQHVKVEKNQINTTKQERL